MVLLYVFKYNHCYGSCVCVLYLGLRSRTNETKGSPFWLLISLILFPSVSLSHPLEVKWRLRLPCKNHIACDFYGSVDVYGQRHCKNYSNFLHNTLHWLPSVKRITRVCYLSRFYQAKLYVAKLQITQRRITLGSSKKSQGVH